MPPCLARLAPVPGICPLVSHDWSVSRGSPQAEKAAATKAYFKLATLGLKRVDARGGLLVCASCTAHVTAEEFFDTVLNAVRASGALLGCYP
eukprot:2580626-Pyramimonas_sp.AAC.1